MKHLAIKSANCNQVYKPRGPVLLMPKFDHTVKLYKTGTIKNITEKILYDILIGSTKSQIYKILSKYISKDMYNLFKIREK